MTTTKMVGAFVLIAALLLGGCSGTDADSDENATAAPFDGTAIVETTTLPGDMTSTPEVVGAVDATATPEAMTTLDVTATPEAAGTLDATASPEPTTSGTITATPAAVGTLKPTPTGNAVFTPTPTGTLVVPVTGENTGDLVTLQSAFEQIYTQVNPSVVYIEVVEGFNSTGNVNSGSGRASGSGFVWDTQGHIVTNNHVVDGATAISVTFVDGTILEAKVAGQDPNADLAVLELSDPSPEAAPPCHHG